MTATFTPAALWMAQMAAMWAGFFAVMLGVTWGAHQLVPAPTRDPFNPDTLTLFAVIAAVITFAWSLT